MNDYKIKELYEEMEIHLIDSMKRNLSRHLTEEDEVGFKYPQWQAEKLKELKKFQRENKNIIGGYVKGLNKEIAEHLQEELRQGSISAIKQYNKLLGDNKNPNKLLNRSFFKTNDRKVKALIKSVNNDLNNVNTGALRMINDEYRQIIHKSAFFVANGVQTEKQATSMAIKEISQKKATMLACDEVSKTFLAGGLNCIEYKNGRRVNIASYASMAVRTASLRAHLMGEGDFRKSIGRTLVKVTSHGGACKICTKWQDKVLIDDVYSGGQADGKHILLSEAMKQGFLHPNCRHGLTTYYPELEGINYDENEGDEFLPDELRNQYNYYNRLGKSWNRRNRGFIDPDNKKDARKNYLACEKKKEDIIRINNLSYKDVTKEWMNKATPNSHKVKIDDYFIDDEGIRHPIKGKEKISLPSKDSEEYVMAQFLEEIFGREIRLIPRIETEKGYTGIVKVNTPDYRWNDIKWDLKTPTTKGEFKNTLERFLKKKEAKKQAKRFIIDYKHFSNKTDEEILNVVENTLNNRDWVEELIVMREKKVIRVYSKSK